MAQEKLLVLSVFPNYEFTVVMPWDAERAQVLKERMALVKRLSDETGVLDLRFPYSDFTVYEGTSESLDDVQILDALPEELGPEQTLRYASVVVCEGQAFLRFSVKYRDEEFETQAIFEDGAAFAEIPNAA